MDLPEAVRPNGGKKESGLVQGRQLSHQPNIVNHALQVGPAQQVVQPYVGGVGQLTAHHCRQLPLPGAALPVLVASLAAAAASLTADAVERGLQRCFRVNLAEGGEESDDDLREVLPRHFFSNAETRGIIYLKIPKRMEEYHCSS